MARFTFEATYYNNHFQLTMSDTTTDERIWSADLPLDFGPQYGTDDPHIMSDPPTDVDLEVSLRARGWRVTGEWVDEHGMRSTDIRPTPSANPQVSLPAIAFERL